MSDRFAAFERAERYRGYAHEALTSSATPPGASTRADRLAPAGLSPRARPVCNRAGGVVPDRPGAARPAGPGGRQTLARRGRTTLYGEAMPRGRPPKLLAPEVREQLLAAVRAGTYLKQAAQAAGISKSTFYAWLEKGRQPGARQEYRDFLDALTRAEAEAEVHAVGVIRDAMAHDWRAAVAYLERHPEGWRRRQRVEHTARDEVPVSVAIPERDAQAAHAFLRAVRDLGG